MNTRNPIPEEVVRFLVDNIDSIAQLEGLLLLRDNRTRGWTPKELAERIYLPEAVTAALLIHLESRGFLAADGVSYRYTARSQEMARLIDQLAEAYAKYLVPVTDLVHRKSRRSLTGFADAFKFSKEDNSG
jgi:hypothetical protein